MKQVNIHIDPLSTDSVLRQMGLAIDEIKLVRSIHSLYAQMQMSESMNIAADRRHYLNSELRFLNKRLESLREKAKDK